MGAPSEQAGRGSRGDSPEVLMFGADPLESRRPTGWARVSSTGLNRANSGFDPRHSLAFRFRDLVADIQRTNRTTLKRAGLEDISE